MGQDNRANLDGREKFGHGYLFVSMDRSIGAFYRSGIHGGVDFHNHLPAVRSVWDVMIVSLQRVD
jgi:hypothetical protein